MTQLLSSLTQEVQTGNETNQIVVEDVEEIQYMDDTERYMDDAETADDDENDEEEEPDMYTSHPGIVVSRGGYRTQTTPFSTPDAPPLQESSSSGSSTVVFRDMVMTRERGHAPVPRANNVPTWQIGPAATRRRGFGQQPIVEPSISPAPSDAASNRSTGTNQSNGSTFFRTYVDTNAQARHGVMTPDLVYAEIGHGRGAGPGPSTVLMQGYNHDRRGVELDGPSSRHEMSALNQPRQFVNPPSLDATYATLTGVSSWASTSRRSSYDGHPRGDYMHDRAPQVPSGLSDGWHHIPTSSSHPLGFTPMQTDPTVQHVQLSSPTNRELHDSIHSALSGQPSSTYDGREVDSRGRSGSVKRSLRNTFTAAEQYASNFFFGGRGTGGGGHDGSPSGGLANGDTHSH